MDACHNAQGRREDRHRRSIVITVVEAKRGSVRIGIDAPPEVTVVREDAQPIGGE